jgi:hypothetical protein
MLKLLVLGAAGFVGGTVTRLALNKVPLTQLSSSACVGPSSLRRRSSL